VLGLSLEDKPKGATHWRDDQHYKESSSHKGIWLVYLPYDDEWIRTENKDFTVRDTHEYIKKFRKRQIEKQRAQDAKRIAALRAKHG